MQELGLLKNLGQAVLVARQVQDGLRRLNIWTHLRDSRCAPALQYGQAAVQPPGVRANLIYGKMTTFVLVDQYQQRAFATLCSNTGTVKLQSSQCRTLAAHVKIGSETLVALSSQTICHTLDL